MDKSYNFSLYRINAILTLFRSENGIYTVNSLADILNVPPKIIRKDLYTLMTVDECETEIFAYDDEADSDDFAERLRDGLEDDTELSAYSKFIADIILPLTDIEKTVLESFAPNKQMSAKFAEGNLFLKPYYNQEPSGVKLMISKINNHINNGDVLEVMYPDRTGSIRNIIFKPLLIIRYSDENVSYVISLKAGHILPLRVDKIKDFKLSEETVVIDDYSPLSVLPYLWKMDIKGEMEVKIRVDLREGEPIREKIKSELLNSRVIIDDDIDPMLKEHFDNFNPGKWEDFEEYAVYTGTVIGRDAFRNWVNGFGSSIVVEEPESLRNEIIESARKRYDMYKQN